MAYNRRNVSGLTVYVENNDVGRAISIFKHITASIVKEVKDRKFHEKKGDKLRRKRKDSLRRILKEQRLKSQEY